MEIINISHNDSLAQIAQKCNLNFKQLAFTTDQQTKKQGRTNDSNAETMVNVAVEGLIETTIPNEVAAQISAQDIPGQIEDAISERIPFTILNGTVGQETSIPSGSYKDINVTFDNAFTSIPNVVATLFSTSISSAIGSMSIAISDITTTGFTARIFNASSSSRKPGFNWIAIG